jgi:integrase
MHTRVRGQHRYRASQSPRGFHDLRHSTPTFPLLQAVAERVVIEILGHTSLAMTSRYMHVLDGPKRDTAD